ncbi:hypothetical protein [Ensifer adhaerens]|uniref:hypothetical protein n=1 Tax=Ensifer adhaerens TaxID=106592 RepID=UPI001C4DFD22|nr:hypothetical protein [Ensifer adhaerens]MBW0365835.1 hypothetical protein [Ensifer adhaerens]UCM20260.1 hypothetical protein LDL63_01240 [Ensifer adhaerens]
MPQIDLRRLELPSRRVTLELASRVSWQLERGYLPSVDDYQARQRIRGRGQTFGHTGSGRLHRIDFTQSLVKRSIQYRDDRVAPRRKVKIVVDLSMCDGSRSSRRLLGTAFFLTLSLCTLKSTSVILKGTGGKTQYRDQGFGNAWEFDMMLSTFGHFEAEGGGKVTAGGLRFDLGDTDSYSYFLVTHFISPQILRQVNCPLGLTTVLVEPSVGRIFGVETGLFGGCFGGTSAALLDWEFEELVAHVSAAVRGRLGPVLRVREDKPLATSISGGINQSKSGRTRQGQIDLNLKPSWSISGLLSSLSTET